MKESKDRTEQFMYSTASAANQAPQGMSYSPTPLTCAHLNANAGTSSLLYAPRGEDIARPGSRASFKGKGRAVDNADVLAVDIDAVEEGRAGGSAYQQMQLVEQQVRTSYSTCEKHYNEFCRTRTSSNGLPR